MTYLNSMKVFQMQHMVIVILFTSLMGSSILVSIPNSSGQENIQIPDWVKNTAEWWSNGEISENEFLSGIVYLINHNIISLDYIPCSVDISSTERVPDWVKNNAQWWAEDLIEKTDFVNGIKYLLEKGIITIDNRKVLGPVPLDDITFSSSWITDKRNLVFVQSSFFEIYGSYQDCGIHEGQTVWNSLALGLNPNKMQTYQQLSPLENSQKAVVVYPYFTHAAYTEPGFYTYYRGECDDCTTTKFAQPTVLYSSSGIGHQALTLLGYSSITDVEIDKNPEILQQFDKVIILHNEYVTRTMFDAITSHPNVVYLYPNALYAEIEVNYTDETITLIRGHNYPEPEIKNGFDWEFDNTHPYEYDNKCIGMEFYQIKNGWMTNCYPENLFLADGKQIIDVLKVIKDL